MTASRQKRILLVEDDQGLSRALAKVLRGEGYGVEHAGAGDVGLEALRGGDFDLLVTDMRLPGMGGLELVARVRQHRPGLPVILITAHGTAETAIEATKRGAFDYLLKPFAMPDLLAAVERALEQAHTRTARAPDHVPKVTSMVGRSRGMQELFKEIGRVAQQNVTVLIRGETGTGKEMVARAIWRHSSRAEKPFLAINCAAIPDTLLESELFGHEKGSFTGADARRIGRFQQADGGTLFLDEIGDISTAAQVRLLRVLQERVIDRVGGSDAIPIDVRVIAATHENLEKAIGAGRFREDLFYRLSAVQIQVPPLRERREDIPLLVAHFASNLAQQLELPATEFRADAIERFTAHGWPGNVRELENVVRRALIAARGFDITAAVIDKALAPRPATTTSSKLLLSEIVEDALQHAINNGGAAHLAVVTAAENELLKQAMELARGNKSRVARWLGLSRTTMREKLQRLECGENSTEDE